MNKTILRLRRKLSRHVARVAPVKIAKADLKARNAEAKSVGSMTKTMKQWHSWRARVNLAKSAEKTSGKEHAKANIAYIDKLLSPPVPPVTPAALRTHKQAVIAARTKERRTKYLLKAARHDRKSHSADAWPIRAFLTERHKNKAKMYREKAKDIDAEKKLAKAKNGP